MRLVSPNIRIGQVADYNYSGVDEICRVKIGARKDLIRIAENLDASVGITHDHIIVNVEIWVVRIFIFAADPDKAAVWQPCFGASVPAEAPAWPYIF
ncbi:hypothetical protein FJ938_03550 [Mesorhizobium sp. B2-4-14]|nr:hypothetical protein FJ938_03550 [Mesorhizobium sp. B2-4-14]